MHHDPPKTCSFQRNAVHNAHNTTTIDTLHSPGLAIGAGATSRSTCNPTDDGH